MTETQWLTATNPTPMLKFIGAKAAARKRQLVGVACCRLLEPLLDDDARRVIAGAERNAEGEPGYDWDFVLEFAAATWPLEGENETDPRPAVWAALRALVSSPTDTALERVLQWATAAAARAAEPGQVRAADAGMRRAQAGLFREVFGNPFLDRTVVPAWMSTGGSTIFPGWMIRVSETAKALADGIEADQAYERLPILADALEEAGCTDVELLAHMREPGSHVRGCWALDLVLGKS